MQPGTGEHTIEGRDFTSYQATSIHSPGAAHNSVVSIMLRLLELQ